MKVLGCRYCDNDSYLFDKDNVAVLLEPVDKVVRNSRYNYPRLKISIDFNDYIIPITYCPFCGKKMEEI